MKKLILFACATLFCAASACVGTKGTRVTVTAQNYPVDTITIAWRDSTNNPVKHLITLSGGKGSATLDLPEGKKISLVNLDATKGIEIPGQGAVPAPTFDFYVEKGNIDIAFDNNGWPAATIKGVRLNNDLNKYWTLMGPLEKRAFESTRTMIARMLTGEKIEGPDPVAMEVNQSQEKVTNDFIAGNPDSELALELLQRQYMTLDEKFEERFLKLSDRVRNTPAGIEAAENLAKAKTLTVGNPAPLFSKTDKDGNKISLADMRGKWVLLDFWGTWCGPCRISHPHLVELYKKYSPEGLVFINIAMESSNEANWRDKWIEAIEKDGLTWTNIADNEFPAEGSMVNDYQINAFPTKILIDPEGKLALSLSGGDVDEKLKDIYGK